jgi:hypothetical protein
MDASFMIPIAGGLAFGLLTGALFYGALWFGVALILGGAPATALMLQLARFVLLTLCFYAAVRFGALALVAASAGCLAQRRVSRWLMYSERAMTWRRQ